MQKSKIEWTDYTWNPITGCLNSCEYCYARRIATRFAGGSAFPKGFTPTFHPERLSEHFPKKPSKIFTCSMGELFGGWLPKWQVKDVFDTIRLYPQHTFQILTKQPQNLIKFSPYPENVWLGVSVTSKAQLRPAIWELSDVQCNKRFISFEPLLEDVLAQVLPAEWDDAIDWVIIGAQTPYNKKTAPKLAWVQEILVAASNAGNIPVFMKNNLQPVIDHDSLWTGWKLRQEFPHA